MREKEIISKAGSAIILLLMKWFKSARASSFPGPACSTLARADYSSSTGRPTQTFSSSST